MATQAYRLTLLRLDSSDVGTRRQTVTIAAETVDEAVELADLYCTSLPRQSLCSAQLADPSGAVLWSERGDGQPDEIPPQGDQP